MFFLYYLLSILFFFFNDTATTEIYTLSLHDALPIYEVLHGAAAADQQIASLWRRYKRQRLEGQRALLRILTERNPLREGLTAKAAGDILFAIGSPETYGLLVSDRG